MRTTIPSEDVLSSLVHDLRQPLGNLETSLFVLEMMLNEPSDRVREQMRCMERQVARAAQLLLMANEELRELKAQRAMREDSVTPEGLPLTKSATAALT